MCPVNNDPEIDSTLESGFVGNVWIAGKGNRSCR
jgi:hypothetical protein